MAILFCDSTYRTDKLFALLQENLPGVDLRKHPEIGNPDEIDYAIILRPAPGSLQGLPNLKLVFTIGAGVDGIIHDTTLPDVPVIRNTDPHLAHGIRDYVIYQVLHYHRFFNHYAAQQRDAVWKQYPHLPNANTVVGIMGVGEMGMPAATALRDLGFTMRSWSRTPKTMEGIQSFHGREQLKDFASGVNILAVTLPLTDETRGILNADLFAAMPKNSVLINLARGAHLVGQDLLDALDSGHLKAATLDVFTTEPLPQEHPFWHHPKITITPHIASLTHYPNLAKNILQTIREFEQGKPMKTVNRERQY